MALKMISGRLGGLPTRVRPMPKVAVSFYETPEWRRLAAAIKQERGGKCCQCGSTNRVIADHIVELKDGGEPLDRRNVQLLCQKHHQQKTAKERAKRAGGLT